MTMSYPFTRKDAKSPEWKAALAWLVGQGAPADPTLRFEPGVFPGRPELSFESAQVKFTLPGFDDFDVDAGLLLRGPSLALTELEAHFRFGDPKVVKHYGYVREVPPAAPPGPTDHGPVGSPIGARIRDSQVLRNFVRAHGYEPLGLYASAWGDDYPDGSTWEGAAGKFRKYREDTPFGQRAFWERETLLRGEAVE
jgi:hypothetical protein